MAATPSTGARTFPPIVSTFGYSPLAPAIWRKDEHSGLEFRDLSLSFASEAALSARHLRAAGIATSSFKLGDVTSPFIFAFVLAGHVRLETPNEDSIDLTTFDCVTRYGSGVRTQWNLSSDAELIEVAASPSASTMLGLDVLRPGSWVISKESKEAYTVGDGPRSYFTYRDLGVAKVTGRRMHIHIVRVAKPMQTGTGWHFHSMGQLFYVLRGWANLEVERLPSVRMDAGDAMCVAPGMRHDVTQFSADYAVVEICIPADYTTIDSIPELNVAATTA
jgi:quercetin dioxygenase-like cupin family protein